MNIIELQDRLKDLPDRALMQEMQMPTGNMPQFLVLSELTRRRRMRDEYNRQMAADMPTVAEEVMTTAGAPQGGITAIARNMTPNSSIAQNTGADMAVQREPTRMPQKMAEGGVLSLFRGGRTKEDLYRQVEPFPENGTATEKRTWNLTYGMTHNVDGTPKMMSPDVATTDVSPTTDYKSPFISDVSANIGDFMPTVPDASQDPSTDLDIGGILAGAQQFDFDRPFAQQDATGGLPVAAPDFDATDENDILDAEEARLVQQEVLDANRGNQPLPDISQIDPETNLDISAALGIGSLGTNLADAINNPIGDLPFLPPPTEPAETESERLLREDLGDFNRTRNVLTEPELSMDELMRQAQIEREGFGAGQTDNTSGITTASRRADREKEGFLDFLPTFGATGEGRGRDYQVTLGEPLTIPENIKDLLPPTGDTEQRQVRRQDTADDQDIAAFSR